MVATQIFFIFIPKIGVSWSFQIQFDDLRIFFLNGLGWFNRQLLVTSSSGSGSRNFPGHTPHQNLDLIQPLFLRGSTSGFGRLTSHIWSTSGGGFSTLFFGMFTPEKLGRRYLNQFDKKQVSNGAWNQPPTNQPVKEKSSRAVFCGSQVFLFSP